MSLHGCSQLGRRAHLHDGLDVGVDELGDDAGVQARVLSSLELILVDIAVVVANSGGSVALGAELRQSDHLRTHVNQGLLVSLLDEISRASTKEATLVEWREVKLELLDGKVGKDSIEAPLEVGALDLLGLNIGPGMLVHDVDKMDAGHLVHFNCEQLVLLDLGGSLGIVQLFIDFHDKLSSASSKSCLKVVRFEEFSDSLGTALGAEELVCLAKVCEELVRGLVLVDLSGLLEEHARRLLVHDNIDTLIGREWTLLGPPVSDT